MSGSVVMIVADGVGTGVLDSAVERGDVPAIAALVAEGGTYRITTAFPSVTGVGYVPLLTGRFPGPAGIPGLRWFDRSRGLPAWLGHSRSYAGAQVGRLNADLAPSVVTVHELLDGDSLGAQAMITRGLPRGRRLDRGLRFAAQAARAHFTGDARGWARIEEDLADRFVASLNRHRPRFAFAAFAAGDKASHAAGADSVGTRESLRLVDDVVRRIRRDAEQDGSWDDMHLWVVSDHGHSPVSGHFDLAAELRRAGLRVRSHPWTVPDGSELAVMVSGNAMAHLYLDLGDRVRRDWPVLQGHWQPRLEACLGHAAIDLVAARRSGNTVCVWRWGRGRADLVVEEGRYSYRPLDGDPLGLGGFEHACGIEAHERTSRTDYPDSVVQLASLALSARSGDLVLSAAPGWDFRERYEPIPHVSSHGGLHRAHMEVPLVVNRRAAGFPRRTVDLFPTLLQACGLPQPRGLDGTGFLVG